MKKCILVATAFHSVVIMLSLLDVRQSVCMEERSKAVKSGNLQMLKTNLPQLTYPLYRWLSSEARAQRRALAEAVNSRYEDGGTLLHIVARITGSPREMTCRYLLANYAEVDAEDDLGRTPLYYAMENGNQEIQELLKAKGADQAKVNKKVRNERDDAKSEKRRVEREKKRVEEELEKANDDVIEGTEAYKDLDEERERLASLIQVEAESRGDPTVRSAPASLARYGAAKAGYDPAKVSSDTAKEPKDKRQEKERSPGVIVKFCKDHKKLVVLSGVGASIVIGVLIKMMRSSEESQIPLIEKPPAE